MKKIKEYLNEAKIKYPSQYDAEFLVEYMQSIQHMSQGGLSPDMQKLYQKIMTIHQPMWKKVFGDKSPWSVESSNRKAKVVWNKQKAEALGL